MPPVPTLPRSLPALGIRVRHGSASEAGDTAAQHEWLTAIAGALRLSLHTVIEHPDAHYEGPVERAMQDLVRAAVGSSGVPASRRPAASPTTLFGPAHRVSPETIRKRGWLGAIAELGVKPPTLDARPKSQLRPAAKRLALLVDRVSCVQEHTELGDPAAKHKNHIYLSGAVVVPSAGTLITQIQPTYLGAFDTGDSVTLGRRIATVDLATVTSWPLRVSASVVIAEQDTGDLRDKLETLYERIREELEKLVHSGSAPESGEIDWRVIIGEALLILLDLVHEALMRILGDDFSDPVEVVCERLTGPEDTFSTGTSTKKVAYPFGIRLTGKYRVSFHWELVDA